jgi:hypothetical protein
MFQQHPQTSAPLSLSSNTTGSAQQATAWRTRGLQDGGSPLPLSSRTEGSVYKFQDDQSSKPFVQE